MKIAIFSTTFFPTMGGAEMVMHNLARSLVKKGHEVHMVVPWHNSLEDLQTGYKINPLTIPKGSVRFDFLIPVLWINLIVKQLRERYDLWQVFGTYPPGYASLFLQKMKVPVVVRATGNDIQTDFSVGYGMRLDPKLDKKIRKVVSRADALVANSKAIAEGFYDAGANKNDVYVIPNGIWLERFRDQRSNTKDQKGKDTEKIRRQVRENLQLRSDTTLLLCNGRNHPKKNYETLFKAVRLLNKEREEKVYLMVVGQGTEELQERVNELGISRYVKILGKIPKKFSVDVHEIPAAELVDLYLASDVFVFPTLIEGFPNVLLEALASGLRIVSTKVEGVVDLLEHKKNAFLINNPRDELELAKAVKEVLDDVYWHNILPKNALDTAAGYDWAVVANKYAGLYSQLVGGR